MNLFQFASLTSLLVTVGLGIAVISSARHRPSNQAFFLLSCIIAVWLLCLVGGSFAATDVEVQGWIRLSTFASVLMPVGFDLLRHHIGKKDEQTTNWRRIAAWGIILVGTAALVNTRFFLRGASLPEQPAGVAEPDYGSGFFVFAVTFICCTGFVVYSMLRDMRRATGVQRMEIQFVLMGCAASLPAGVAVILLSKGVGEPQLLQFLPLCAIVLDAFMAYGIVTRRIMAVSYVLQRMTSYALLFALMLGIYLGCRESLRWVATFFSFGPGGERLAESGATLIVVFSVIPARGWVNRLAAHLFIGATHAGVERAREKAVGLLQMVTRVDQLLAKLADVIQSDMRSGRVKFFLHDEEAARFVCQHPQKHNQPPEELQMDHPLVKAIVKSRAPVVSDALIRLPRNEEGSDLIDMMQDMSVSVAMGIYSQHGLQGLMLLGPRASGRIYDAIEQRALSHIVNQLGVSLENARLYTAIQEGKLYTDLIVDSLASGLVAVDHSGSVTVMNRRALEITGLEGADVSDLTLDSLPAPVASVLNDVLNAGARIEDMDLTIQRGDDGELPLRVTSSLFRGSEGEVRGALMLMSDLTELRKLEEQVRRHDRLSSIGTLSAGMAHEIKNPLVAIKTFTQLLPERYTDADFRDTFFNLISHEVQRIDFIVNRLLGFARPATASLEVIHIHGVLEESLQLVSQQAKSHSVKITHDFNANPDSIRGDAGLLKQAFVNFFLNAIEAMPDGGQLSVTTRFASKAEGIPQDLNNGHRHLVLTIQDTGCGIAEDGLRHIFDPFYTTKSTGTGLGLSVAHGILQEHQVAVDVQSTVGEGTRFSLVFIVADKKQTLEVPA